MSSDLHLNIQTGGPPPGTVDETQYTDTGTPTLFADIPVDTQGTHQGPHQDAGGSDYSADSSTPRLGPPSDIPPDVAFTPPSRLPREGDPQFEMMAQMFIPPGGTPEEGAQAYKAFLSQYTPFSNEYQALLATAFPSPNANNLVDLLAQVTAAKEQIWESLGVSEPTDTSPPEGQGSPQANGQEKTLFVTPDARQHNGNATIFGREQTGPTTGERSDVTAVTTDPTQTTTPTTEAATPELDALLAQGFNLAAILLAFQTGQPIDQIRTSILDIQNWVGHTTEVIQGLPDSPEKAGTLNYLRKISEALQDFVSLLFELQLNDTKQSRDATQARLTETLDKIDEQRKAMIKQQHAAKKSGKKKKMGVMGKILQGVAIATLLIGAGIMLCFPPLGPLVAPILILQAVDMCMQLSGDKKGLWGHAFEAMDSVVGAICSAMNIPPGATHVIQIIAKFVVATIIVGLILCSGAFLVGGGETIKSMINETLFKTDLVKDKKAQMIIGMSVDFLIAISQLIVCAALMIVPGMQEFAIAGAVMTIGSLTFDVVTVGTRVVSILSTIASVVTGLMSMADSANNIALAKIKMDINKHMAKVEEDQAFRQILIDLLKKLIKTFQDSIQAIVQEISAIQGGQNKLINDLTNEMGKLYTA